jgi:squalene synthase HpnC
MTPPVSDVSDAGEGSSGLALARARQMARASTENFVVLSRFVPRHLRDDFAAVYAFCRVSDDIADEHSGDEADRARAAANLESWRRQLHDCVARAQGLRGAGSTRDVHWVFRTLEPTIARHALDPRHFDALLDAFVQDQTTTRWPSVASLMEYSRNSANPVGRLVLALFGITAEPSDSPDVLGDSDAVCTGLQLVNFWQDVRRDLLERDRIYVPLGEVRDPTTGEKISERDLREWMALARADGSISRANKAAAERAAARYARAVEPLLDHAGELLSRGHRLIDAVPPAAQPVLSLFVAGGERTLARVRASRGHELFRRPRVPGWERAWLLARVAVLGRASAARAVSGVAPHTRPSTSGHAP